MHTGTVMPVTFIHTCSWLVLVSCMHMTATGIRDLTDGKIKLVYLSYSSLGYGIRIKVGGALDAARDAFRFELTVSVRLRPHIIKKLAVACNSVRVKLKNNKNNVLFTDKLPF